MADHSHDQAGCGIVTPAGLDWTIQGPMSRKEHLEMYLQVLTTWPDAWIHDEIEPLSPLPVFEHFPYISPVYIYRDYASFLEWKEHGRTDEACDSMIMVSHDADLITFTFEGKGQVLVQKMLEAIRRCRL